MKESKLPFRTIIFVCVNERPDGEASCGPRGAGAIRERLKAEVKARGLKGRVRVSQAGCMDLCALGPNVMVFPDGIWYQGVTEQDVPAIIERHMKTGEDSTDRGGLHG
jgi:(2Fe-2S) ferredoxin